MKHVSDEEYAAVSALSAPQRYDHFIRQVADWERVWSLQTAEGWLMMKGDAVANELVPVWPHARYALAACAQGDWTDALPESIPLDRWLTAWIPGLIRDERQVAVFPLPSNQGIVVAPERLRDDLLAECEQYE